MYWIVCRLIFVMGVNHFTMTNNDMLELFHSFYNTKEIMFSYCVYCLCGRQFMGVECDWPFHLWYYSPKLCLRGVCVDHRLFWEILIRKDRIFSNNICHLLKGVLIDFSPFKFVVCWYELCQWSKNRCVSRPHI